MAEHPIATYELDEEQLLAATITEIGEARVHLGDAEQCLLRSGTFDASDAALHITRAANCARVAHARVDADELPLFITKPTHGLLQRCVSSCDVALAHARLLAIVDEDARPQALSHAKKAVDAARGEMHRALAALLTTTS